MGTRGLNRNMKQLLGKEVICDVCTNPSTSINCAEVHKHDYTNKDSTRSMAKGSTDPKTVETDVGYVTSTSLRQNTNCTVTSTPTRTVTYTPTKTSATAVRTQLLYSLSPKSTGSAQEDLKETEEGSLTSLLNGALKGQALGPTDNMPSLNETHDESFNMLTLVRPSMIPDDVQQPPE